MTKTEVREYTKNARYWLRVIDGIIARPGPLDSLSQRNQKRLMRAATEAAGTVGMLETIFEDAGFDAS